jgi:hypothetical protein
MPDLIEYERHAAVPEGLQRLLARQAEHVGVLLDQLAGDLADVIADVAVIWWRLVPRGCEQRAGEPVDLRAGVVEVVLRGYVGAFRAQQPGQRVLAMTIHAAV